MTIDVTHEDGLVYVVGQGEVDLDRIESMLLGIRAELESDAPVRMIIRDEGTTFAPHTDELREFMGLVREIFEDRSVRLAVLADRNLQYGVARMLQARSESIGIAARAFRLNEEPEAREWVREGSGEAGE